MISSAAIVVPRRMGGHRGFPWNAAGIPRGLAIVCQTSSRASDYLLSIGLAVGGGGAAAGEIANVNQAFQPDARCSAANSL